MRSDLVARYREGPDALQRSLSGVDLDFAPDDGWTPRQIVHHLADLTIVGAGRLRRLIAEDAPHIASVNEDRYAERLHYERAVDDSLAVFRGAVASNCDLLESLDADGWNRSGTHEEYGAYSVEYWLERQVNHVHEHAEQIAQCRR